MLAPTKTVPIDFLHLETGAIFLFLVMVTWTEYVRANEPDYDVLGGKAPLRLLPVGFLFMVLAFTSLLYGVSPFLGLELAAGIALSLLHPANALCFMVLLQVLRPWEIGPVDPLLTMIPRFGVSLCAFSWLIHPKKHVKLTPGNYRAALYVLAFSAWLLLSAVRTPSIFETLQRWLDAYFKTLSIFVLTLFLIESERSVRELQMTLVISSLSLIASGVYQFATVGLTQGRLISGGTLGDPNDVGAFIVMALPFVLVPAFRRKSGAFAKTAGLLHAAATLAVIWLTRSRGTMLALVGQFLVVRLVKNPRKRLALLLTACVLGAGYLGVMQLIPREQDDMEASEGSRITYWKTAVNMAAHNPLFGVGYAQYPEQYMSYAVGRVYERGSRTAHSSWFLALGETGFVGLFLFCGFFVSVVRLAWRSREKRPAQLYAVAGYGVAMSFLSHTYSTYFYTLMALVMASYGVTEREKARAV
jgi:O-antigen ligase